MKALSCRGLLSFLALVPLVITSPIKLKERIIPPRGWNKDSTPPADHKIALRIGLPQPNFNVLRTHLYEVSDPYHPRYGAYLSKEEVDALVAPHQASIDAVDDWLASHGIQNSDVSRSPAGDWVTITLPVYMVEKMLDTKYHVWKHDNGNTIVRTTSYSLPEHLHEHIEVIQPTTIFAQLRGMKSTIVWSEEAEATMSVQNLAPILNAATGTLVDASCNTTITITCLKQLYNAVGLVPSALNNSIAVTGYLEQFANFQDLQSFYAEQNPAAVNSTFDVVSINVPKSYALRVCNGLAQLGARGVSLTFSSGDFGVGDGDPDPATQQCFTNDGTNTTRFQPLFPASCPYVTSVGGTVGVPEVAVTRFFSGGGFSDYFERPSYQDDAVNGFLKTLPAGTYEGLFNPEGRGIPDVAAQGDRFRIFLAGVPRLIGGTSASSPTFAGLVALLNDARLSQGLPSLGFLNPLLYTKGLQGFNDILIGHNPGCGTDGFNVTEGWDPVTGLGTPNVMELQKLIVDN
ncbi:hypothetical protein C0993_008764 [Termitomyces sp. T159_Od127]|nr:hypothetical protein C0993_008764 [Termitomyces sp. T159_Od127]